MVSTNTAADVAVFLKENLPDLRRTKNGKMTTGGTDYYNENNRPFHKLYSQMPQASRLGFHAQFGGEFPHMDSPTFDSQLVRALSKAYGGSNNTDWNSLSYNEIITTPLAQLQYILILDDRKKSFLYDPVKDIQHNIEADQVESRIKFLLGEEANTWYATNRLDCLLKYLPLDPRRLIVDEETQTRYFNTWEEATWRKGWAPAPGAVCPVELAELMGAVIKGAASQKSVWDWLRDAVFTRANSILVLRGKAGLGKNLFFEDFLRAMVGSTNYGKAEHSLETSAFHKSIGRARAFLIDEKPLTGNLKEILKSYHNKTATLTEKYERTGRPQDMHASFILCNNSKRQIKLEYTDRKFFLPDLTETKLVEVLGQVKIDTLLKLFQDDFFLKQCGSYLFTNYESGGSRIFPKTESFREIAIGSYPAWFRKLMSMCAQSKKVTSRNLSRGGRTIDAYTVKDELEHYDANFGHQLGALSVTPEGAWEIVSNIYEGKKTSEPDVSEESYLV